MAARHVFSVFDVTRQVFYESATSLGIVNLKPLRPGHVLVISKRNVPRLADLEPHEVSDLFQTVQRVGRVVEKAYAAEALNIAVQDGVAAGQSVPHVHAHIIPRLASDFGGETDNVYPALEKHERGLAMDLRVGSPEKTTATLPPAAEKPWSVAKDEERKPRSLEEMEKEASWLRSLLNEAYPTANGTSKAYN